LAGAMLGPGQRLRGPRLAPASSGAQSQTVTVRPARADKEGQKVNFAMSEAASELKPTSAFVNAMLTDMYQISMCYAHWKSGRHRENSVFDFFFRKNPFQVPILDISILSLFCFVAVTIF
jgi:hypothetical protein